MAEAIEVEFVVLSPNSMVHVLGEPKPKYPLDNMTDQERASWHFVHGYVGTTLCGRDVMGYKRGGRVGTFGDDDLCASCHHLFPGEKALLFEHEIPSKDS